MFNCKRRSDDARRQMRTDSRGSPESLHWPKYGFTWQRFPPKSLYFFLLYCIVVWIIWIATICKPNTNQIEWIIQRILQFLFHSINNQVFRYPFACTTILILYHNHGFFFKIKTLNNRNDAWVLYVCLLLKNLHY